MKTETQDRNIIEVTCRLLFCILKSSISLWQQRKRENVKFSMQVMQPKQTDCFLDHSCGLHLNQQTDSPSWF